MSKSDAEIIDGIRKYVAERTESKDADGIYARLGEVRAMLREIDRREWQPIETAPKDNGARLVWCPDRRNTFVVTWGYDYETDSLAWMHFGGNGLLRETPTHWMPLLAPPTEPHHGDPI